MTSGTATQFAEKTGAFSNTPVISHRIDKSLKFHYTYIISQLLFLKERRN
ncbi:hypothetical protein TREPR_3611 [Treponema primitia ZAS-2]|uniref:Uncharacterized protein n=1 Tax=Treponema primitia (strain ATCC BAA-887 / DSM 12427 / ZAS-2) TaxID=545694 RepID=F5YR12_TREPZ|nr:hypothetical protein TREPR_3611 [Treponema primitia ZAS-2]